MDLVFGLPIRTVLGMTTAAAAPLLTLRRLSRTDIPATLRVIE